MNKKRDEFHFLERFGEEANLSEEVCREQLRSLWTAYCLHNDLDVDTAPYDHDVLQLWSCIPVNDETIVDWDDFNNFSNFMAEFLV